MMLLVGAGAMAVEYSKVLTALEVEFEVVCRTESSAREFEKNTGKACQIGGVESLLDSDSKLFSHAIVSVSVDGLYTVANALIEKGVKKILLEKPGGMNVKELSELKLKSEVFNTDIVIGYNRRCYASTNKAKEIIRADGGVKSFSFEITEWGHVISKLDSISDKVKENWFLANTTHLIDLAFHLCGRPVEVNTLTSGTSSWHPKATIFSGCGVTENNALFSYIGNWNGPGRLRLDIVTANHRLIFCPVEKLQVQEIGQLEGLPLEIDDILDKSYKPGLFNQVECFLNDKTEELCSLADQVRMIPYYNKMAGF